MPDTASSAPPSEWRTFLTEFVRNPRSTAAIAPSSRRLARQMLEGLDLSGEITVVEYGPGSGVFTREALDRLDEAARLVAIERNPRFAEALRARRPRADVHLGDAQDVLSVLAHRGLRHADAIISGLGWPSIPDQPREAILEATAQALKPGGEFRTFGYHVGLIMGGAWRFRKTVRRLFSTVTISPVVWMNLPPAFVYRCVK
ncbi:MAG: methyltransferase domain-containing protein [Planctomycetota bacterium]